MKLRSASENQAQCSSILKNYYKTYENSRYKILPIFMRRDDPLKKSR